MAAKKKAAASRKPVAKKKAKSSSGAARKKVTRKSGTASKAGRRSGTSAPASRTRKAAASSHREVNSRKPTDSPEKPVERTAERASPPPETRPVDRTPSAGIQDAARREPTRGAPTQVEVESTSGGAPGHRSPSEALRVMGKGNPPPFVVARGEDHIQVFDEALKMTGFLDHLEEVLAKSGKRRETFEIVAKVDFMESGRKEEKPVTYVDPRLVRHLFNMLLDRGYRLLRVVESKSELCRFQKGRAVKLAGRALGYDESCYELRDLGEEVMPIDLGHGVGRVASGVLWNRADCRINIAKNRTHELFGPALLLYNVYRLLPTPTGLLALEQGLVPGDFVTAMLEDLPVHYNIIEAFHSMDGTAGGGEALEFLRDVEGAVPKAPRVLSTNTVLVGTDTAAVEAAGQRMQGLDAREDKWFFQKLRRATGCSIPEEVDDLPIHQGWSSLGTQIRSVLDLDRPLDTFRYSLYRQLAYSDPRQFPPQPGGYQRVRLRQVVQAYLDEIRRHRGVDEAVVADRNGSA